MLRLTGLWAADRFSPDGADGTTLSVLAEPGQHLLYRSAAVTPSTAPVRVSVTIPRTATGITLDAVHAVPSSADACGQAYGARVFLADAELWG